MPTQAELWIQNMKQMGEQDIIQVLRDPQKLKSVIKARMTGEQVNLSSFEQNALSLPAYPAAWLHQNQQYGGGPFTELLLELSNIPAQAFVEVAGASQKISRNLGFSSDPMGIRGKIREASSLFVLPALLLAAPVAVAGAKEGHKMYQAYQKGKKK